LLGLQDFPGQGTALVGLLDALLTDKGSITRDAFREFCAPHVLLARFERHTWLAGENFAAGLELAHYGPADFVAGETIWTFGAAGKILAQGRLRSAPAQHGGLRPLARLEFKLPQVSRASAFELHLRHGPSGAVSRYPLWVYPSGPAKPPLPANVTVASVFDDQTRAQLATGRTVLLCPTSTRPLRNTPGGGWAPDFWCWSMFKNVPGTLGLSIDHHHPALAGFPTENHSDWQWFHLARAAQPVVLDELDRRLIPIVEVIDNPERAHRLGLIFEALVGPGRLLVCAADLPFLAERRPEARALLDSLVRHAGAAPAASLINLEAEPLARALAV
jgi:hypothetical protein